MEAGPETDALIATEVMDWHWDSAWGCLVPSEQQAKPSEMWTDWEMDEEGNFLVRKPIRENWIGGVSYGGSGSKINLPEWSTKIDSAMRVVDHILQNWEETNWEPEFCLTYHLYDEESIWCKAYFGADHTFFNELEWLIWGEADTPALAICIAALELKGIEVE